MPLTGDIVRFGAHAEAALDVSALVVAENLKVFSSDDFVFYNQPATAGVALTDAEVTVTLAEVRADAKAVLLVVSADPAPLGGLGPVTVSLSENSTVTAEFAITPLAGETARWSKPDSCSAKASANEGLTPMRRAVSATIVFISSRLGTGEAFSSALFSLAELTTAGGYVKPRKELGTRGLMSPAGCSDVLPGMVSFCPG